MANSRNQQFITSGFIWYFSLITVGLLLSAVGLFFDYLIALGAILGVIFLILVVKKPFWGLLLYVALVWLRPSDVLPALAQTRFQAVLLALLLLLWIIDSFIVNKRGFILHRIDKYFAAFIIAMGLSIVTSVWLSHSVENFSEFLRFVLFYIIASQMLRTEEELKKFTWVILGCITFVCLVQIWTYLTIGLTRATGLGGYGIHIGPIHLNSARAVTAGVDDTVNGVGGYSNGFLANASELGLAVLILVPFAYYLFPYMKKNFSKILMASMLIIFFVSLVACGARGAFVGIVAVLFVLFLKSQKKILMAFSGLILLAVAIPLVPERYIERIASTANYETDESANIRLTLWSAGVRMVADRPLLGVGVGNFSTAYGSTYRQEDSANLWWEPHNNFIQSASEMGLLGLVTFVALMVVTFRENKRSRIALRAAGEDKVFLTSYMQAIDIGLIGYIVSGCFITSTYYPHLYLMAMLARTCSVLSAQRLQAKMSQTAETATAQSVASLRVG